MEKNKKSSEPKPVDPFRTPLNLRSPNEEFEEKEPSPEPERTVVARLERELTRRFRYFFLKLFLVLLGVTALGIVLAVGFAPRLADSLRGTVFMPPAPSEPAGPAPSPDTKPVSDPIAPLVQAIRENTESHRRLVEAILEGNKAIGANLEKLVKEFSAAKEVSVGPGSSEQFSIETEKRRILELAGIDIDDPILSKKAFSKIQSKPVMDALIQSFDRILQHQNDPGVGEFRVKNAKQGKTLAVEYRKELK
jgi:hypothetical protein